MKTKRKEAKRRKEEMEVLEEVVFAFLLARGQYPPDYRDFFEVAGERQADLFYETMWILEEKAEALGYNLYWFYDPVAAEWKYTFIEIGVAD